jgi:hypothetical protein
MLVNGRCEHRWHLSPFCQGLSALSIWAGVWMDVPFRVDTGADATFLDYSCIAHLGVDVSSLPIKDDAGGVAGTLSYYEFPAQLRLEGETSKAKIFSGNIGILEETLTPAEQAELLAFVQQVEQRDVIRAEVLVQLAKKRGATVSNFLQEIRV